LLHDDEGSVVERVGKLLREAQGWARLDGALAEVAQRLDALCADAHDLADTLRNLAQRWQADPGRREHAEDRWQLLRRLETKYGRSVDDLIAYRAGLAAQDRVATLVFDEIDANVGGRLGDVLGQKLAALGKTHQVICVTHLPQVASFAQHQWSIRKSRRGKRTTTTISLLSDAERL